MALTGIHNGLPSISRYVAVRALVLAASVALAACSTLGQTDEAQIRGMLQDKGVTVFAAGAELVLASHDHDYERFAPQDADGNRDEATGIRQFVVGTGGATLTPLLFRKFHSESSNNTSFGVLLMQLKSSGYEWEFLPADKDGFSDRGAALCH